MAAGLTEGEAGWGAQRGMRAARARFSGGDQDPGGWKELVRLRCRPGR